MNYLTPEDIIESRKEKDKNYPNECLMRVELIPRKSPKHYKSNNGKVTYWIMKFMDKNGNWRRGI